MRLVGFVLATLLITGVASGESAAADKAQARALFQEGIAHTRSGDLDAAVRAFEAAYAKSPHYSVLYNIGQAQLGLGKHAHAVQSFEKYLRDGGREVSAARREEVSALIDSQRGRLGSLKIIVAAPEQTRVWVDSVELSRDQLERPLLLTAGKHHLLHSAGTGHPTLQEVVVAGGDTAEVQIPGPTEARPHESKPEVALLSVGCDVPGMSVAVDGRRVAETPLALPLLVTAGERTVLISRAGYRSVQRKVVASSGAPAGVRCDERPQPGLAAGLKARLQVQTQPARAEVFVDGQPFTGPTLPAGVHDLRVEHPEFQPYRRQISVEAGKPMRLDIILKPTSKRLAREQSARARRTTLAYVLAGTGAALLATGAGLLVWNQGRYDTWRSRQSVEPDATRAASIQRVDDLALGAFVVGTGLAATGTWFFITDGRSHE